jgi:hypothetical protein
MGVGSLGHLPIHAPTPLLGPMLKGSLFDDLIEQSINAFGAREFEGGQCVELRKVSWRKALCELEPLPCLGSLPLRRGLESKLIP